MLAHTDTLFTLMCTHIYACGTQACTHTNVQHHTHTSTHAITAMHIHAYRHTHACMHMHTRNVHPCKPMYTHNTGIPSYTKHIHAHACTHARAQQGQARTTFCEEQEGGGEEGGGRYIILFPPVQMTSLAPTFVLISVIFLDYKDMGWEPNPWLYRWKMRFLAMNLLEQNDITTEELGGPLECCYSCSTPAPIRPARRQHRRGKDTALEAALASSSSASLLLWTLDQFAPHLWSFQL